MNIPRFEINMRKITLLFVFLMTLVLSRASLAQDTNAAAPVAPGAAVAAAAAAPAGPKPDPAGTATGAAIDAQDAGGTHFVVSEPTALSDDDKKDPAKVKKFGEDKKAFDEYTAQAKVEPLAVKL